jgi:GTPase SAR1 family protein
LKNEITKLLLSVGPVGCGKTSLVELYCKENSIELYKITSEKTKKETLQELFSFSTTSENFFSKKLKKLLFIDEYQNGQTDAFSLTDIQTLGSLRSEELKKDYKKEIKALNLPDSFILPPLLIISSDSKGSKLSDLKKSHEVYYINEIPVSQIKTWIASFQFDFSENILNEIIAKSKSDKRLLLGTLLFLDKNKKADPLKFIESFYKDTDLNIFEFINTLFDASEPIDLNEIFKIYETDGFLLSHLVHENYLDYNQDIESIARSAEAISFGETIFSDTYESTRTFLPEAHCLNSLCIPSYYSRSFKVNKNVRSSSINNRYNIYLNNKKIHNKVNTLEIFDIYIIKNFLNPTLIKTKVLNQHQQDFIKNISGSLKDREKLELLYKHFSDFKESTKSKNFTLKFKEKIKAIK